MSKRFAPVTFDFETQDLTPRISVHEPDVELDTRPAAKGRGGKVGTIADDHNLDLTKRPDTLGGLLEPLIPQLGKLTYKEVVDALEELLCKVGKNPEQNRTVSKWRQYLRAARKPSHSELIHRITNAYLTAASLDVEGRGIGGRKKD